MGTIKLATLVAVSAIAAIGARVFADVTWPRLYGVYQFEHGAFVALPVGTLDRCHQEQQAARDGKTLLTIKAPYSIEAAGIIGSTTYNIVGVSCPDDAEGG